MLFYVAGAALAGAAFVATREETYRVERSVTIQAAPCTVRG